MSKKKIKELHEKLAAKQKEVADVFAEAGEDLDMDLVKSLGDELDSKAKVAWIQAKNDEMVSIKDEIDELVTLVTADDNQKAADEYLNKPAGGRSLVLAGGGVEERKSMGELFVESDAYENKGASAELDLDVKADFETTAGWAPETTRTGRVVDIVTQPIEIIDLVSSVPTDQSAVVYMEETTFTNTAAETAEGGTFPEATLVLTERSSPVRKIAVFLPITDEQLEDVGQASAYVNNRLPFMVRQRLQTQMINGDGIAPNLEGIVNVTGIQTYALAAEPVPDAIHRGITLVRVVGRSEPDAIGMHPNDWQDVRLLRTADGIYIMGNPSDAVVPRLWGLPVSVSTTFGENTALVGAYREFAELATKRGIEVKVSDSHGTFFIEGKQAIRADMRVALTVYRPAAFCTVTGI